MNFCLQPTHQISNTPLLQFFSFLLVPLQNDAVHDTADLD